MPIIERSGRPTSRPCRRTALSIPTGVGDAFRGGLLKGLARGASYRVCAQIGSVAATYALEHLGGQSHAYHLGGVPRTLRTHFGHPEGL